MAAQTPTSAPARYRLVWWSGWWSGWAARRPAARTCA